MSRLLTYAAFAIAFGTTATLALSPHGVPANTNNEAVLAADGAFRDGLYLGRLAAEDGRLQSPPIGRWSSERDRAMFAAGWSRGYASANQNSEVR